MRRLKDIPFSSVLGGYFWHSGIREDTAVEKLHDVEGGTNDGDIFTEDDGLGNGDDLFWSCAWVLVVFVQGTEDPEFTFDLVRCLGEQLAGGFFSEDPAGIAVRLLFYVHTQGTWLLTLRRLGNMLGWTGGSRLVNMNGL